MCARGMRPGATIPGGGGHGVLSPVGLVISILTSQDVIDLKVMLHLSV